MTDEELREALETCIHALRRIACNDPGPAYYIAKQALEQIPPELLPKEEVEHP